MGNLKQIIIFLDPKFTINPINKEDRDTILSNEGSIKKRPKIMLDYFNIKIKKDENLIYKVYYPIIMNEFIKPAF